MLACWATDSRHGAAPSPVPSADPSPAPSALPSPGELERCGFVRLMLSANHSAHAGTHRNPHVRAQRRADKRGTHHGRAHLPLLARADVLVLHQQQQVRAARAPRRFWSARPRCAGAEAALLATRSTATASAWSPRRRRLFRPPHPRWRPPARRRHRRRPMRLHPPPAPCRRRCRPSPATLSCTARSADVRALASVAPGASNRWLGRHSARRVRRLRGGL